MVYNADKKLDHTNFIVDNSHADTYCMFTQPKDPPQQKGSGDISVKTAKVKGHKNEQS